MEFVTFKESLWNPYFHMEKKENGNIETKIEGDGSVIDAKFSFHFKYENGVVGLLKGDCEHHISSSNLVILQILEDPDSPIATFIQVELMTEAFSMTTGGTYVNKNTVTKYFLNYISKRLNDELNKNTGRLKKIGFPFSKNAALERMFLAFNKKYP